METKAVQTKLEIWHKDYNLDGKENLDEVPQGEAVFGIFGIVDEEPVNCRYVGQAEDLQKTINNLYETPPQPGMQKFMHGPNIPMLVYQVMPQSDEAQRKAVVEAWEKMYQPKIDEEGEYPGYYDY